jgi:CRISPR-associated endonuclease/helicase Cas3
MNSKANPFTYFEVLDRNGDIWAKNDGTTLQKHSFDAARIADEVVKNLYVSKSRSKFEDSIKDLIIYSAYIHDAGKADRRWQKYIKGEMDKPKVPHPLFSLPIAKKYLEENLKIENRKIKELFINLGLLSIATHHSAFNNDKYSGYEGRRADYLFEFEDALEPYSLFYEASEQILDMRNQKDRRYLYVLINGVLSFADWMVSVSNADYKRFDERQLDIRLTNYFKNKIRKPLYPYQEKARGIGGDLLIQLPTGCGKTETALWWLVNLNCNKLFYTLPTVTTVDAMRKRFEGTNRSIGIFEEGDVSFSHHLLELSLMVDERLEEGEFFVQKHLLRSVAVTTIDRILLSLMNHRRYAVSEVMLNNAALIIDEIHSYSPFTFSLIIEALRYLKEYHNVKLCIMSATFPDVIKDALFKSDEGERARFQTLIPDERIREMYRKKRRTKITAFYEGKMIEDNADQIVDAIKAYKKVLVVVNTVWKAQNLFEIIKKKAKKCDKDINFILFHGRFIYRDRGSKQREVEEVEERLKDPANKERVILISTQIVEVSLDIDYNVLFTEIAPIDAIIQRAGRVNRKGKEEVSDIYVFDVKDDEKGYLPYKEEQINESRNILSNIKIHSELDYLDRNNEFYESLRNYYETELKENRLDEFLKQIYEKKSIDKALQTRDGFLTVPVVPVKFEEDVERINKKIDRINEEIKRNRSESKRLRNERLNLLAERSGYFVPVPFYTAVSFADKSSDSSIMFIRLKYSSEIGIYREEEKEKVLIL